jgi:hypothetical protein
VTTRERRDDAALNAAYINILDFNRV